ncbi:uncharacterized protein LOC135378600 isoform X2 [Ornithodoros turicata]|uniref:uncharacterized protein LOC135378600 isoform X2 n=1 Tax=Ornithodoros turicata TaxID=34597 RepID=UPI00313A2DCF
MNEETAEWKHRKDRLITLQHEEQIRLPLFTVKYTSHMKEQSTPSDLYNSFTKAFHFGSPLRTQEQYCALDVVPWLLADGAECIFLIPLNCCVFPVITKLAVCDTWKGYMLEHDHLIPCQYSWQDPLRTFQSKSEKNGLRVKTVETMPTSVTFQSRAEFKDYLRLTIPFVTRIPAEKRPQFLDNAFDLAIRSGAFDEKDGTVVHEMNFLAGLCKKVRDV